LGIKNLPISLPLSLRLEEGRVPGKNVKTDWRHRQSDFLVLIFCFRRIYRTSDRKKGGIFMAYFGSKGWLVQQLKEAGIRYHPVERKKLETYRTATLIGLYQKYVKQNQ
jgi:hypothetical protein